MNDDRRRLDDIVAATGDAALIVQRGRAAFDADPLVVRAAKNIVTEIGEATKHCRLTRPTRWSSRPQHDGQSTN